MAEAVAMETESYRWRGCRRGRHADIHRDIGRYAVAGNPDAVASALEASNALIDSALALDTRLARRARWVRSDDGIFADAGLVASGDDSPCYDMSRAKIREYEAAGTPVNVVVSTDGSPANLEAFIAVARIVQQFRPLNVWWQGAWLTENSRAGVVFLAPLIQGDMDFARVQFVLSSRYRDHLSFYVMETQLLIRMRYHGNIRAIGHHAEWSFLPGDEDAVFVDKGGIQPTPEGIAASAARWLGWASHIEEQYRQYGDACAALQRMPDTTERAEMPPDSAADARYERWRKERQEASVRAMRERTESVEERREL
jgi:hypothetical protein